MTRPVALVLVGVIFLLGIVGILVLRNLNFDYDFDDFFQKDDSVWIDYSQHRAQFGHDNDYLLLGIRNDGGIYKGAFLEKVKSLTDTLSQIKGITRILSPLDARKLVISSISTFTIPYVHLEDNSRLPSDSVHLRSHPNLANRLINHEEQTLAIVIYHDRFDDKEIEKEMSDQIDQIVSSFSFSQYHLAGRIQAQKVFVQLIEENFGLFIFLSLLLVSAVLYLIFRRIIWIIFPLIAIAISVVLSLNVMVLSNQAVDVLTSMIPTILLVTAMSDIIHYLSRYFDLLNKGLDRFIAIRQSFKEVGQATLLTSVTTAIGFATLYLSESQPVKSLGIYTAVGIMITYVVTFAIIPATASLINGKYQKTTFLTYHQLSQIYFWTIRNKWTVIAVFIFIISASVYQLQFLRVDTPLIADFPRSHQVTRDFKFFDQAFNGSKPLEIRIVIEGTEGSIFDEENIRSIDKVTTFVAGSDPNVISPSTVVKSLNMAMNGGQPPFFELPSTENWNRIQRNLPVALHHFPIKLTDEDYRLGRISGFTKDLGSKAGLEFYKQLVSFIDREVNDPNIGFELTGTSYLFDLTTERLVYNIVTGLSIAILVVAVIMLILFRSFRIILIALIPNLLPLLFLASGMAFFGIPLRLSTSIIFAIAFGIAVDDTIHFLIRFRQEFDPSKSVVRILLHTYTSTGKAMILTTLILSSGFIIFTFSSFNAAFYTGLLISITLIIALVVDMTLLPILLLLMGKKNDRTPQ